MNYNIRDAKYVYTDENTTHEFFESLLLLSTRITSFIYDASICTHQVRWVLHLIIFITFIVIAQWQNTFFWVK